MNQFLATPGSDVTALRVVTDPVFYLTLFDAATMDLAGSMH
ncbi:MAG: hypothetical protein R2756_11535 [Bacteroidales bacterium]